LPVIHTIDDLYSIVRVKVKRKTISYWCYL
jgi:hypothetical protein